MVLTAGDLIVVIGSHPTTPLVVPHLAGSAAGRLVDDAVHRCGTGIQALAYRPLVVDLVAWHQDLWWALPDGVHDNVVLAAGPTAAFLPLAGGRRILLVDPPAVPEGVSARRIPQLLADQGRRQQRKLGPSANPHAKLVWLGTEEAIPLSSGVPEPADRWRSWVDEVASQTELLTADRLDLLARELGRALRVDGELATAQPPHRRLAPELQDALDRLNWLDGLLLERARRTGAAGA